MVIRASEKELDISGSPHELNAIADRIVRLKGNEELTEQAEVAAEPHPYDRCLGSLRLRITDGPVRVSVVNDHLEVTASSAMMLVFAAFFRFDLVAKRGTHNHHEWFEGDEYIARNSRPLVISIE